MWDGHRLLYRGRNVIMFIAICILIIAIFACAVCPDSDEASQLYYDADFEEISEESEDDSEELAEVDEEAAIDEYEAEEASTPKQQETVASLKRSAAKHDPVTSSVPSAADILEDMKKGIM